MLRDYLALIDATLRTNYWVEDAGGAPRPTLTLKLDSAAVPGLPAPRPHAEAFVYSPRMEGLHLRAGLIARGGIRWSERPRRPADRGSRPGPGPGAEKRHHRADRGQRRLRLPAARGRPPTPRRSSPRCGPATKPSSEACSTSPTTSWRAGSWRPPGVRPADGDDPYLVVAADRGTASLSDLANDISAEYGFWLGDAFASGGSHGYDHKAMGITARGAWIAVRQHFRQLGMDVQTTSPSGWPGWATCRATCSETACSAARRSSWWPPSTIGTSSSTPIPIRPARLRGTGSALRPAPLELAGLRPGADLARGRGVVANGEGDRAVARGPGRPGRDRGLPAPP